MGLRQQAAADLKLILEDSAAGFGWPIRITDPTGASADLTGFKNEISRSIDPMTGEVVSGRVATVTLSLQGLAAAGLGVPKGVAERSQKPWVVEFADVLGNTRTFKVASTEPDDAGLVVCVLEAYQR